MAFRVHHKSRITPYQFNQEDSLTKQEQYDRIRNYLIRRGIIVKGRNIEDLIQQYIKLKERGLI